MIESMIMGLALGFLLGAFSAIAGLAIYVDTVEKKGIKR